ncbi:MAG TPA: glycosyltransferase [Cytophagaceae bacterium]|nr:glycosyltransferase [Cytophagaceae bacterium]
MDKKNILYISYDGMTDPLGQSQVIPYLTGLSKQYEITILSCEKPSNFSENKEYIAHLLKENNIHWECIPYHKKPPVLSTLYDYMVLWKTACKLHRKKKIELIHCRSYISALVGLRMKKKFGIPFLFDMRGLWVNERVDGKIWNLKNPVYKIIYKFFKRKEKQFLENAAYTISLTNVGKLELLSWTKIKNQPLKIEVIPCSVDIPHFSREHVKAHDLELLKKELKIEETDFIITYLGSLGTWYMLEDMLDFFKVFSSEIPQSKFLFVTADSSAEIFAKARSQGVDTSKILIRKASRKDVPTYLALSRYSIFFIKPVYSKLASSPTKQGEIMSMGIPLICNAGVGDTDLIVQKYEAGFLIPNTEKNAYRKVAQRIKEGIFFDEKKIREGAEDWFSLEKGIASYAKVYEQILG